jgi:methylglutaconyl-CoA hydratase
VFTECEAVILKNLKLSQNQGVLTVSLNRPEKRNAFFPEMIREIAQAFGAAAKDKTLRAVLLTGEGESFCSGGDLEWMRESAKYTKAQNLKDANELFAMFWAIYSCPVPVVGRVFGHCFGGGAGLNAVCDIVAAESKTKFSFSEVKWGLVPAVISPFVYERAQSSAVSEWFMTAKIFAAPEAQAGGLIGYHGSISEVDGFIETTLAGVLASAPQAVRQTKKLLRSYSTIRWKSARALVTKTIAEARAGTEGQKGLSAFINKENPKWSEPGYGAPAKI